LRLEQQYFFVACSLKDALRIVRIMGLPIERLPRKSSSSSTTLTPASASPS